MESRQIVARGYPFVRRAVGFGKHGQHAAREQGVEYVDLFVELHELLIELGTCARILGVGLVHSLGDFVVARFVEHLVERDITVGRSHFGGKRTARKLYDRDIGPLIRVVDHA